MSLHLHTEWTNPATGRVYRDVFIGHSAVDLGYTDDDTLDQIADDLRHRVEEMIDESTDNDSVRSWASIFVASVDWDQLAAVICSKA